MPNTKKCTYTLSAALVDRLDAIAKRYGHGFRSKIVEHFTSAGVALIEQNGIEALYGEHGAAVPDPADCGVAKSTDV